MQCCYNFYKGENYCTAALAHQAPNYLAAVACMLGDPEKPPHLFSLDILL